MKPIEIHIEGYKIVISEDDKGYEKAVKDVQPVTLPYTSEPPWMAQNPKVTFTSNSTESCTDGMCDIDFSKYKSAGNDGHLVGGDK